MGRHDGALVVEFAEAEVGRPAVAAGLLEVNVTLEGHIWRLASEAKSKPSCPGAA